MLRTHEAGALRAGSVGETVTLTGWVARRRDHGGVAFLDLRDASGIAQVVVRDEAVAHGLRNEYCLQVTGEVAQDLAVPDQEFSFGTLQAAQAAGDRKALADRGRPLLHLHLTDRAAGIRQLLESLG